MTKRELAEELAAKIGSTHKQAIGVVEALLKVLKDALKRGEAVKLAGFGTLCVKWQSRAAARNVHSGESLNLGPNLKPKFIPSKQLRKFINKTGGGA